MLYGLRAHCRCSFALIWKRVHRRVLGLLEILDVEWRLPHIKARGSDGAPDLASNPCPPRYHPEQVALP
ncbi:hypothetical protein GOBAR_AA33818 [Gossypium barbadense]|uniref:Uncharacterized protein n=1 Tax=Gossypium barbadense TaxID=3634 RepID=A0A2P5W725_GOSBA|nr:hypothetical protein GOBAR_AA33818 [Gossypium barbadense]